MDLGYVFLVNVHVNLIYGLTFELQLSKSSVVFLYRSARVSPISSRICSIFLRVQEFLL